MLIHKACPLANNNKNKKNPSLIFLLDPQPPNLLCHTNPKTSHHLLDRKLPLPPTQSQILDRSQFKQLRLYGLPALFFSGRVLNTGVEDGHVVELAGGLKGCLWKVREGFEDAEDVEEVVELEILIFIWFACQ
jgi:hypothetical protein